MTSTQTSLAKFQGLLRELFQFDCGDLDFGIYRIMNRKRDVAERFITEQLPASISAELDSGPLAQQAQATAELAEAAQSIRSVAPDAIDEHGVLAEHFRISEAGQTYLAAQTRAADSSRSRDAVEASIYNHLYAFFNRYYDEGDFISKRRYSRNQRYAIPYNGEEVYLHWANNDQYYVKTDEHFRNYDWKAPNGISVRFRLRNADVEQNNVKGDRRFFIPLVSETECDADGAAITIPFEYRPLSPGEAATYGRTSQQDKINTAAVSDISQHLRDNVEAIAALTTEHRSTANGTVSHLEHHLRRYVQRNNADFFIHKDLAGFLNRELDFYLKNEVLNLDNLAVAGQNMSEGWFQQMRLTKAVGSKIIDFLAQIENFQKMLWEKRKFVTETQYCITLGHIAPEFYSEISANEAQWDEWRDLHGIDGTDRNSSFLSAHPTLVLDTKHFADEFVDRLLGSLENLDSMMGGLLIHGENFQALTLIERPLHSSVKVGYYDPPYNTSEETFVYKNDYRHSSWLAMMSDRIAPLKNMFSQDGVVLIAVDDEELYRLKLAVDHVLGSQNYLGTIVVESNPRGRGINSFYATSHDYYLVYAANAAHARIVDQPLTDEQAGQYRHSDYDSAFRLLPFRRSGGLSRTPRDAQRSSVRAR